MNIRQNSLKDLPFAILYRPERSSITLIVGLYLIIQHLLSSTALGQEGFALRFDGDDDFVSILDSGGHFDFGTSFSVEAWVNPLSLESSEDFKGIVRGAFDEEPQSGGGWVLFLRNSDLSEFGFSVCTPECHAARSPANSLHTAEWQHLAATYDGSLAKVYRNGELIGTRIQSGDVTDITVVLIGIWGSSFNGLIDEVRIWNTPRTQAEIQANMARTLLGTEEGLVGYWNFNEGQGQQVFDLTAYQHHGRLGSLSTADSNDPVWVSLEMTPNLSITRSGSEVTVAWRTIPDTTFVLEETTSLSPPVWTPSPSGSTNPVTVDASALEKYFRLRQVASDMDPTQPLHPGQPGE